jgi:hypothetical protein
MRRSSCFIFVGALLAGCGGGAAVEEAPLVAPVVAPPPPREAPQVDARIWYVYWDGIHSLTIYPRGGVIRSEEPANAGPPYGGQSAHFSVMSHYFEQEDLFGPLIGSASSLEELLRLVREVPLVEVVEETNPVYEL